MRPKEFVVNGNHFFLTDSLIRASFGTSINDGTEDRDDVRTRFDALEIGETLIDEDGDTWERIA